MRKVKNITVSVPPEIYRQTRHLVSPLLSVTFPISLQKAGNSNGLTSLRIPVL